MNIAKPAALLAFFAGFAGNPDRHAYVQIWQYDPKVGNWGLRIFLENP